MATIHPLLIELPPLTKERLLLRAPCAGDGVALNETVLELGVDGQPRDTAVYSRVRRRRGARRRRLIQPARCGSSGPRQSTASVTMPSMPSAISSPARAASFTV